MEWKHTVSIGSWERGIVWNWGIFVGLWGLGRKEKWSKVIRGGGREHVSARRRLSLFITLHCSPLHIEYILTLLAKAFHSNRIQIYIYIYIFDKKQVNINDCTAQPRCVPHWSIRSADRRVRRRRDGHYASTNGFQPRRLPIRPTIPTYSLEAANITHPPVASSARTVWYSITVLRPTPIRILIINYNYSNTTIYSYVRMDGMTIEVVLSRTTYEYEHREHASVLSETMEPMGVVYLWLRFLLLLCRTL